MAAHRNEFVVIVIGIFICTFSLVAIGLLEWLHPEDRHGVAVWPSIRIERDSIVKEPNKLCRVRFEINEEKEDLNQMQSSALSFLHVQGALSISTEDVTQRFQDPSAIISGCLLKSDGTPCENWRIELYGHPRRGNKVRTTSDGSFEIFGSEDREHTLLAYNPREKSHVIEFYRIWAPSKDVQLTVDM